MANSVALLDEVPLRIGAALRIDSGKVPVRRILCGNAGMMTGPGTNTYLIGRQVLSLIDPGPLDKAHLQAILDALGAERLHYILLSHGHADHAPGVVPLKAATGAQVIALAVPAGSQQDVTLQPDLLATPGQQLHCDEYTLQLLHTPGHVSNHLCFLLEQEGMLFTGDHILQGATPVILPPDGNMADYLRSLRELRELPLRALAPGHGHVMTQPQQAIAALIRHRRRRETKVCRALTDLDKGDGCELDCLLLRVYDDVPAHLLIWARRTLQAHLFKLAEEGLVRSEAGRWFRYVRGETDD